MNVNDVFIKEKKRKWNGGEEISENNSKRKNGDIKPNLEVICKNIKKEPDFMVNKIKKESDAVVKEIKKEPNDPNAKFVITNLTEIKPKTEKRKMKITKTFKKVNKRDRKTISKMRKKTSKKSTQRKKTKSLASKKSTKKKKKVKAKKKCKNAKVTKPKKEANTLLDKQSKTDLRLFGFRDELEYFSSESNNEEHKKTSLGSSIIGKRTSLSSLDARKKVLLALKSTSTYPSSKAKPIIQLPENKNVDLLGSILESQALWHSKNSHMKVNEDGTVEVISKRNKLKAIKLANKGKEIKASENKSKTNTIKTESKPEIQPTQEKKNIVHTQCTVIESVPHESLNLNESREVHLRVTNIKTEPCNHAEAWDSEAVIDENKELSLKEKIKIEIKEEKEFLKSTLPSSFLDKSFYTVQESTFRNSVKAEKSVDEDGDSPIISLHSKEDEKFSLHRNRKKQVNLISDKPEIEIVEYKKCEKTQKKEMLLKLTEGRNPLPKRKNEEKECIIIQ